MSTVCLSAIFLYMNIFRIWKSQKLNMSKSDVNDTNLESEEANASAMRIVTRHPWWMGFKLVPQQYKSPLDFVPEYETGETPYFWVGWGVFVFYPVPKTSDISKSLFAEGKGGQGVLYF